MCILRKETCRGCHKLVSKETLFCGEKGHRDARYRRIEVLHYRYVALCFDCSCVELEFRFRQAFHDSTFAQMLRGSRVYEGLGRTGGCHYGVDPAYLRHSHSRRPPKPANGLPSERTEDCLGHEVPPEFEFDAALLLPDPEVEHKEHSQWFEHHIREKVAESLNIRPLIEWIKDQCHEDEDDVNILADEEMLNEPPLDQELTTQDDTTEMTEAQKLGQLLLPFQACECGRSPCSGRGPNCNAPLKQNKRKVFSLTVTTISTQPGFQPGFRTRLQRRAMTM